MPEWRKTLDDEEIWTSFESMVFGDQQRKDRVHQENALCPWDALGCPRMS